jgi:hypothetical protein
VRTDDGRYYGYMVLCNFSQHYVQTAFGRYIYSAAHPNDIFMGHFNMVPPAEWETPAVVATFPELEQLFLESLLHCRENGFSGRVIKPYSYPTDHVLALKYEGTVL